jgi:hypothetical protein
MQGRASHTHKAMPGLMGGESLLAKIVEPTSNYTLAFGANLGGNLHLSTWNHRHERSKS